MFNKKHVACAVTAVICAMANIASAQENAAEAAKTGVIARNVKDMLVIESTLALKAQQARELEELGVKPESAKQLPTNLLPQPLMEPSHKSVGEPVDQEKPKDTAMLLGIFGLGNTIYADVQIDGQRLRFQSGHKSPLGYSKSKYQLVNIQTPCATISSAGKPQTLCIDGKRPE